MSQFTTKMRVHDCLLGFHYLETGVTGKTMRLAGLDPSSIEFSYINDAIVVRVSNTVSLIHARYSERRKFVSAVWVVHEICN